MYQRKPRPRRLWFTATRFYAPIDLDNHVYEAESRMNVLLFYFSDGSTRLEGVKVIDAEPIPGRPDLVNVVSLPYRQNVPIRTPVSADDYKAHRKAVGAYQKLNPL